MKCFRFLAGTKFRQVTEDKVRASIAKLPANSPKRANGAAVLALEIGQSVTFESGVHYTRIADDASAFSGIICRRGRKRRCQFCSLSINDDAGFLCDGPPTRKGKKTCDAFMCHLCRTNVGPNRDLCRLCARR